MFVVAPQFNSLFQSRWLFMLARQSRIPEELTISVELIIIRIRDRLLRRQVRKVRPAIKANKVHRRRLKNAVNVARLVNHQRRLVVPVASARDERQPPEDGAVCDVPAQRHADVVAAAQPPRVRAPHRRPARRPRALAGHGHEPPRHQPARVRVRGAEVARELRRGALERDLPRQRGEHGAARDRGLRHVPLLSDAVGVERVLLAQAVRGCGGRGGRDGDGVGAVCCGAGEGGGVTGGPWDGTLGVDSEWPA